jgi:hypothetical protein
VNGSEIAGNIAIVYRGECDFGLKALNAQNAGAIAVVFISNNDDMNFNMLGNTFGPSVTIPVVMIPQSAGPIIRPALDEGTLTMFIGNNFGAFPFNLKTGERDVLVPPAAAMSPLLAQNAGELAFPLGGWIHNRGSATQTTARMNVRVDQGSTVVYEETSDNATIASGDSLFVDLGTLDQSSYSGRYTVTYTVLSDEIDGFPSDDEMVLQLAFGETFCYGPTNETTGLPIADTHVMPADNVSGWTNCIHFTNTNAQRVGATGMYFSAATSPDEAPPIDSSLVDHLFEAQAFLWTDDITSPFTTPSATGLSLLTSGEYSYADDLQQQPVYVPFIDPLLLESGERYLFCIQTFDPISRLGWNASLDYEQNFQEIGEPVSLHQFGSWFNGFTGLNGVPSIGVRMVDANSIGIEELENVSITPYPNPAARSLRIPVQGLDGAATLQIFAMDGAKVAEQRVNVGSEVLTVDVSGVADGTYLFQMAFANGQAAQFRVVVAK